MTDRAEEILQELLTIAAKIDPAIPAELDRRYDIADEDLPLIVVRSGDEEVAPAEGAPQVIWDRRWVMTPSIEIYIREPATSKQRAEMSRLWAAFRAEFKASRMLQLISQGTLPEMKRTAIEPDESADIAGLSIELGLTFDR
jgi:hypothetical protein